MYRKKVTFSSNTNLDKPTTKEVYILKGSYQRIIETKPTTTQNIKPTIQNNRQSPFKKEEQKQMNLSYSLSDIDENELKDEMLDDVDLDLVDKTTINNFDQMSTGQKLFAIAQRTQELKQRADEFDAKMKKLNDQYHFLDKNIDKQSKKVGSLVRSQKR